MTGQILVSEDGITYLFAVDDVSRTIAALAITVSVPIRGSINGVTSLRQRAENILGMVQIGSNAGNTERLASGGRQPNAVNVSASHAVKDRGSRSRAHCPLRSSTEERRLLLMEGRTSLAINWCRVSAPTPTGTASHASLPTDSTAGTLRCPSVPALRPRHSFAGTSAATAAD
jgi:hypothetical protein